MGRRLATTPASRLQMPNKLVLSLCGLLLALNASITPLVAAINPTLPPDVFYVAGSTRKISQLIGDTDFERLTPTETRTASRFGLTGSDLGVPFTHNGLTYLAFGDSLGGIGNSRDPLAFTSDIDPEDGMQLTFLANGATWRPITIPGISQGSFEVPLDAVSIGNRMYLYHSTDHSDVVTMGRSVLAVSNDNGLNFQLLYTLSSSNFINVSVNKVNLLDWPGTPVSSGEGIFLFGSGSYRASNVRLAFQPASGIEDVTSLRYFIGLDAGGGPLWSSNEADAIALFDQPSVGELSVAWNKFIKRWVMLYNSGTPRGINFRTARQPWGPWSQPQVLFEPWNDGGYAHFMHVNWTFRNFDNGQNPGRENEWGGEYGPYMFKELATGSDNRTTIYFTMSVWNPYRPDEVRTNREQRSGNHGRSLGTARCSGRNSGVSSYRVGDWCADLSMAAQWRRYLGSDQQRAHPPFGHLLRRRGGISLCHFERCRQRSKQSRPPADHGWQRATGSANCFSCERRALSRR